MPSSVLRGAAGRQPSVPASWGAAPGLQQRGMGLAGLQGSCWGRARTLATRSKRVLSPRSHRACAGFLWPHRNGSEPAESSRAGQLFQAAFSDVEETFQASCLPCTRAGKRAVSVSAAGSRRWVRLSLPLQLPHEGLRCAWSRELG